MLPVLVCAGPCEMPEEVLSDAGESEMDTGTDCPREACFDHVEVTVIRGDNGLFDGGQYAFAGTYPDGAWVTAICNYDDVQRQLYCDNQGMSASADPNGNKMTLLFQGAPETLQVETAYDGISLGVVTLAPAYGQGNGVDPTCPNLCRTAAETVAMQPL